MYTLLSPFDLTDDPIVVLTMCIISSSQLLILIASHAAQLQQQLVFIGPYTKNKVLHIYTFTFSFV